MSELSEIHPFVVLMILLVSFLVGVLIAGPLGGAVTGVLGLVLFVMTVKDVETETEI